MIAAGILNIALWPIFTSLHGPTSINEEGELFGIGSLAWGALMEGPAGLLIALGLAGSYALLTSGGGRAARIGFALAMIGAVVPAIANLVVFAVVPPLLAPLFGGGLLLIVIGNRHGSVLKRFSRRLLAALGLVLVYSTLWFVVVRPDVLDRIDGYRIYGLVANVLFGVGWILLGANFIATVRHWAPESRVAAALGDR